MRALEDCTDLDHWEPTQTSKTMTHQRDVIFTAFHVGAQQ